MTTPRRRTRALRAGLVLAVASAAGGGIPGAALAADEEGTSLTVYSSADPAGFDPQQFVQMQRQGWDTSWVASVPGFGVVKEVRKVPVAAGVHDLSFTDVAQFIDPTTVSFSDLTDPRTAVLEQNFQFDLVSPSKLVEKYVDREITHETLKDGQVVASVKGKVLSANQGMVVLQAPDGIRFLSAMDPGIRLPSLPEGLLTKPTLVWKLSAEQAGDHKVRTTYQTNGMTWRADYNVVLSGDDTKADISAWVSLLNLSGASFKDTKLKLVAGDVQRIRAEPEWGVERELRDAKAEGGASHGFEEKSFFEYHLYTLPRKTDVLQNSTQQITLFPAATGVDVEKLLVYYGAAESLHWNFGSPQTDRDLRPSGNPKLDVYVRFRNEKANRMGMPLPKGKVRVYKQDDADGTLEFVGEDLIDHTPRDEKVLVKLGQAFDVVGERTQTDFQSNRGRKEMTETFRITLRNHKDAAQKVLVKENLYRWHGWEITAKSDEFTKIDSRTIHFDVTVPPHGEKQVTYTVRYTW
ncbi:MAG: hypothetical protein HMLKMBBP_00688 [Planctomycetes bacterium]|nr:hypothetical protein [Planctomycetota bacterium]